MASVNALSRELVFKIVYYGPGLGGKTTTLEHLHAATKPEHRGKLVSLATPVDRTLYFDFLPVRLPPLRGMHVRLQLFTVPGQVYFNATRKLVLTGADGIIFVSDSQVARADANIESLENLRENLTEQGRDLEKVPLVFQHNKRDLPDLLPVEELDSILNPLGAPSVPSSARSGEGVFEALERITELVLQAFEARLPPELSDPEVGTSFAAIEGGLMSALRDAAPSVSPGEVVVARLPDPAESTYESMPADTDVHAPEGAPGEVGESSAPAGAPDAAPPLPSPTRPPPEGGRAPLPASPVLAPARRSFSFAELWPDAEQEMVREVEAELAAQRYTRAVELCEVLVARVLASAAGLFGTSEAPRDPALIPLLLGLNGARYLAFRATVREARAGTSLTSREALAAFAFAIDARIARTSLRP
jgi:signal recognition particle receptor subunit beta